MFFEEDIQLILFWSRNSNTCIDSLPLLPPGWGLTLKAEPYLLTSLLINPGSGLACVQDRWARVLDSAASSCTDSGGRGSFPCSVSCSLCDHRQVTCALRAFVSSSGKRTSELDQSSSRAFRCDGGKMAPGLSQNHAYFYCCPSEHPGPRLCGSQHLVKEKLSKGRSERHTACRTQQRMFSRPQPLPGN